MQRTVSFKKFSKFKSDIRACPCKTFSLKQDSELKGGSPPDPPTGSATGIKLDKHQRNVLFCFLFSELALFFSFIFYAVGKECLCYVLRQCYFALCLSKASNM